jgi:hypothetical protein
MPSISLPDATKFDSDSDTIKESRPELKTMADAINTIGAEYNAGTLGGSGGFSAVQVQLTNGGSYTLEGGNKHYFIEVGWDDNDSSGTLDIDLNVDNLVGSEVFFITFFSATEDGTGSGAVSVNVNWKYGGSLLNTDLRTANASQQVMYSVMTFPAQTQYGDNYNADLRIHYTTLGGNQINWTL